MSRGKWAVVALMTTLLGFCLTACAPNTEPIERATNTIVKEVVKPAVEKATAELTARTSQVQGQGSLINPGYHVRGIAGFGPMAVWSFEIGTDGVSANVAAATQSDAGQAASVKPPVERGVGQPPAAPPKSTTPAELATP